jgi:hypothetical protein
MVLSQTLCANDTASVNAGSTWAMLRGTKSYAMTSANKKVFSMKIQAVSATPGWIGGVDDGTGLLSSYTGSSGGALGAQAEAVGATGATCYFNNNAVACGCAMGASAIAVLQVGMTMYIAINFNNGDLFCSKDCVQWLYGSVAGNPPSTDGNPDSDLHPTETLTTGSGSYKPAWSGIAATNTAVLNTTPTLTGCSNIGTFSQWG